VIRVNKHFKKSKLNFQKRRTFRRYNTHDIGFIGLGQMGFRMAENLIKGGKKKSLFMMLYLIL